ncbi:cytochrome P450 [Sporosarcina sp. P13]|uniref:cytochrome P450 n=1 Tax=Sporosarcina sp. P13 TaxID=2048263 RepID=UPI000C173864|nr:cytochrome P450 [Sporosarcina sp. P13]PIC63884.1 cytochrome P450 [Sporosarcina sp. P13]
MTKCPIIGNPGKKVSYLLPIDGLSTDEEFNNIHSWFARNRGDNPVQFDSIRNVWNVFQYRDVEAILKDHKNYSMVKSYEARTPFRSLLNMDPPDHTKMRRLVSKPFSPRVIEALEPKIKKVSNRLVKEFASFEEVDIMNDYAYPLTITMLTELLGVPAKDKEIFKVWADSTIASPKDDSEEAYKKTTDKITEMLVKVDEYLLGVIAERRKDPQEDLISNLIISEIDGELLSDQEILEFSALLLQAGFGTTARLISNAVRCIIETPGLQQQLRNDPSLLPAAIEEIMRLYSSIYQTIRYAKVDMVIQGQQIKAGEELSLWIASANRDELQYENPDVYNMERGPNHHIAFGKGVHFCLGASLARLEVKIALETLFENTTNVEFRDQVFKPIKSHIANGLEELWICLNKKS